MDLRKHIAYNLLADDTLAMQLVTESTPKLNEQQIAETFAYVSTKGQKAYYITETLLDKLDMLLVKKLTKFKVRIQDSDEILTEVNTFDWRVFYNLKPQKVTFVLPDDRVIRMVVTDKQIWLCELRKSNVNHLGGYLDWVFFYIHKGKDTLSQNWVMDEVLRLEEFIYKLLCFFYLSDNEEIVVAAGAKHGTRKQGKLINHLPFPITIVNSRWNVTSIRTEGFDVRGHFRLWPTKDGTRMIPIQPYRKHGYIRHAKKDVEL